MIPRRRQSPTQSAALTWNLTGLISKAIAFVSLVLAEWVFSANVYAVSSMQEIEQDQIEFRQFFQSRFPDLDLEDYRQGASALPQFSRQRSGHQILLSMPPYETVVKDAQLLWKQPMASGATLSECFSGKPPPTAYPFLFQGEIHTIESDINNCLVQNGNPVLSSEDEKLATLVAAYKSPFRGQPIDIDIRDENVRALYDEGKQYFWAKRGQMNLSCANCHVHNAGNQLRGDVLSSALGHGAGYPAFSIRQFSLSETEGQSNQASGMQTLHQRYQQCNVIAGAAPLPSQSATYLALELYQAIMNAGLPIDAPGLRQ
ncbi:MAG: sulfur oxidation c-type cytochrome SoxA [Acidiferrobacterales bacterium]|nr:sulfur oxidation c-type cytochrome SoxA [Acidiferrobacterales bacterium]